MKLNQLIAKRTKQLLRRYAWSQYELAIRGAIPFSTLSYIVNCKCKTVSSETLLNICRGFGITLGDFFGVELFELENIEDND